jgi:TM2 domain-containing membrane protein YozV
MKISPQQKEKLNPGLAAVLSFLFSGLGQIYNGKLKKGLILITLSALSMLSVIIGTVLVGFSLLTFRFLFTGWLAAGLIAFFSGLFSIAAIGIYSIYDAYNTAKRLLEQ